MAPPNMQLTIQILLYQMEWNSPSVERGITFIHYNDMLSANIHVCLFFFKGWCPLLKLGNQSPINIQVLCIFLCISCMNDFLLL